MSLTLAIPSLVPVLLTLSNLQMTVRRLKMLTLVELLILRNLLLLMELTLFLWVQLQMVLDSKQSQVVLVQIQSMPLVLHQDLILSRSTLVVVLTLLQVVLPEQLSSTVVMPLMY